MKFTHSGAFLASADQNGVIKYFQPNMNNLTAWTGHREAIRGLSFSPDDTRFATASDDSTIRLWSFEEQRAERTLLGHGWDVKCVEWHPSKGLLASGSKDNMIKFWDPRTGTVLSTLYVTITPIRRSLTHSMQALSQEHGASSRMVTKRQSRRQRLKRPNGPCLRHPRDEGAPSPQGS